jgi:hypothetical protein
MLPMTNLKSWTALFESMPVKRLGPGFEIRRGQSPPEEGTHIVLYRIVIWGTLKIYASIADEGTFARLARRRCKNMVLPRKIPSVRTWPEYMLV